jgi:hypothetical protein
MRKDKQAPDDIMWRVAVHEAGHAVAHITALRAMRLTYPPFDRVFIRPDWSKPYIDSHGREQNCVGMMEGEDIYKTYDVEMCRMIIDEADPVSHPELRAAMISRMEWQIIRTLSGPYAEANLGPKYLMDWNAAVNGHGLPGENSDNEKAARVFADYLYAKPKRQHGFRRFELRAKALVLSEWPAIQALAKGLMKQNVIEYDEAHAIVVPLLPDREPLLVRRKKGAPRPSK